MQTVEKGFIILIFLLLLLLFIYLFIVQNRRENYPPQVIRRVSVDVTVSPFPHWHSSLLSEGKLLSTN